MTILFSVLLWVTAYLVVCGVILALFGLCANHIEDWEDGC